jgi:hypothetical protein
MNNFTICADFTTSISADPKNASLQIMDFDLYPSATDLGPVLPDSHLYIGHMFGRQQPVVNTGYLDFSNGNVSAISLPSGTAFPRVTAIAVVKKMVAGIGSSYHSYLSDCRNWQDALAMLERPKCGKVGTDPYMHQKYSRRTIFSSLQ